LGVMLSGDTIGVSNVEGAPIRDDSVLFLINAHYETISLLVPGQQHIEWQLLIDTARESGFLVEAKSFASGDELPVIDRGACLLKLSAGAQAQARQESFRKRPFDFPHGVPRPVPGKKE